MICAVHDLEFIRRRLARYRPELVQPGDDTRQAAVAVILKPRSDDVDILFIKRAETPGDPWSGHMAFPGGHRDPEDADLCSAAVRETWEEIGVDLNQADYLGALDHQQALPAALPLRMLIAPHVFELKHQPSFRINHEVAEVVWGSLRAMVSGECHQTEIRTIVTGPTVFNGYRLEAGHFVWGLTYRMLKSLFSTLDPDWVPPPEAD